MNITNKNIKYFQNQEIQCSNSQFKLSNYLKDFYYSANSYNSEMDNLYKNSMIETNPASKMEEFYEWVEVMGSERAVFEDMKTRLDKSQIDSQFRLIEGQEDLSLNNEDFISFLRCVEDRSHTGWKFYEIEENCYQEVISQGALVSGDAYDNSDSFFV